LTKESQPIFEQELSPAEVQGFQRLIEMEAVHNELGANLSAYRDQIIKQKNELVKHVAKRYGIANPVHAIYDPWSKKIVSIFHPNLAAHRIEKRPYAFRMVAFEQIQSAIRMLTDVFRATDPAREVLHEQRP